MSSIPRKPTKIRRYEAFQTFPHSLPDVTNQRAMNTWYDEMRRVLQRINDDVTDPLDDLRTLIDKAIASISGLQDQVMDIHNTPAPIIEDCCEELRNQIILINNQIQQILIIINQPPPVAGSGTGDDRLVFALMGG